MNFKRIFVLLLCLWLPLQVSATNLAGCHLAKSALDGKSEPVKSKQYLSATMQDHCDHSGKTEITKSHHADCNYCKTHCSNSFLAVSDKAHITAKIIPLFSSTLTQHYFSVYLDQPQRPPQQTS